ncbi:hypothetical protein [Salinirubrum litoreum]|uniref:Uncharacterized protein n=1 Tax=Salinirubrum litoreum TaxID=1126234 RepID=A0ABD5RF85_9EURY|nr:hypothetical protein [Salinirubrum litoreum]
MDRISALRNVEDAIRAFEAGESDLAGTERRVVTVLRTYATEFEAEGRTVYRATGDEAVADTVVVAESRAAARDRVRTLADDGPRSTSAGDATQSDDEGRQTTDGRDQSADDDTLTFEVEPLG